MRRARRLHPETNGKIIAYHNRAFNITLELLTYPGSICKYRNGKLGINEVLMVENIFVDIKRGKIAKISDIKRVFKTTNIDECYRIILDEGMIQISTTNIHKHKTDIIQYIHDHFTEPITKQKYSKKSVQKFITRNHINVDDNKFHIDIKRRSELIVNMMETRNYYNRKEASNIGKTKKIRMDDKIWFRMDKKDFKKKKRKQMRQEKKIRKKNNTTQKNHVFLSCDDNVMFSFV
eukprot:45406_1